MSVEEVMAVRNYGNATLTEDGIKILDQQANETAITGNPQAINYDANKKGFDVPSRTTISYDRVLFAAEIRHPELSLAKHKANERHEDKVESEAKLLEITFADKKGSDLEPKKITLSFSGVSEVDNVRDWIMQESYRESSVKRSFLIIINPHGGKGRANKLFKSKIEPILKASNCHFDVIETTHHGHALKIALEMDIEKYDVIACASGDGIPHEVLNGLFQRPDRAKAFTKVAITQLPCGSGNAMSATCHGTSNPSYAALRILKSPELRMDIMCCSQESYHKQPKLSFLSQTYGAIAEADINTNFIRWVGPARFNLGVGMNVLQRKKYPCDIYVKYAAKSKDDLRNYYRSHKTIASNRTVDFQQQQFNTLKDEDFNLRFPFSKSTAEDWEKVDTDLTSNISIFYAGKMPYIATNTEFFPAALPDDGTIDLILTDTRTSISKTARILLSLDKGTHALQPEVVYSKVVAYKLIPKVKKSMLYIDGENFPFEPLQVEILPRLCKTLSFNSSYVDTGFESM